MTLMLMPDMVKMSVAFLRAQAEVVALLGAPTSVRGKLTKGTVYPAVRVARITDEPIVQRPFYVEAVRVQFDCYGGNNRQAERVAQTVRSAFMERGIGHGNTEGWITNVIPRGLTDLPDEAFEPTRERYILELEIWVRPK